VHAAAFNLYAALNPHPLRECALVCFLVGWGGGGQVRIATKWPHVAAHAAACASRPAYAKAFGAATATKLAALALRT
jgi:glutathione S-transferase